MRTAHRCLDGEDPERRASAPLAHMCEVSLETQKEKEEKNSFWRKVCLCLDRWGEQKIPGKTRRRLFFFIQLTGPKAFYRPQQNRGKDCGFVRPKGLAVCSLYIEDALPSTSHCTCRLNNVHTCQQIRKLLSHAFFPSSILPPTSPTQTISRSQYFDISVSCMLRCHQWRYRYVYARQRGARHHAAVPHGWRHILVLPMHVNERPH
jgi:hypothetical protein